MPELVIHIDESGDLGWKFDAPFRRGGSSRYLTVASVLTPREKTKHAKRVIRNLYDRLKWDTSIEKKWSVMEPAERARFIRSVENLRRAHPDIQIAAITVQKENVQEHIRRDPNKLYNYMTALLLLDEMVNHEKVTLVPDERAIKVASGNSLHDYIQTKLWFEKEVTTEVTTNPADSSRAKLLQFADMLAGAVWVHHENQDHRYHRALVRCGLRTKCLYFR